VLVTWAQIRADTAMAYLMLDSLDGAAAQMAPVLELAPEMRIDTVTGYLRTLDQMLSQPRFAGNAPGGQQGDGLQQLIADETVPPSSPERPGYDATSDQNTCTSKWPLDGSGSP
jgi:hypothetical protein